MSSLAAFIMLDVKYHAPPTKRFAHSPNWTRLVQWTLACGHALGLHPLGTDVAITNMSRTAVAMGALPTGTNAEMLIFAATHLWTASKVAGNAKLTIEDFQGILSREGITVDAETLCSSERRHLDALKWKVVGIAAPREFVDLILASFGLPLTGHVADLARSMTDILVTCATIVGEPRYHLAATCIHRALDITPAGAITPSAFSDAFPCAAEMSRGARLVQQCVHYGLRASCPESALWYGHIPSTVIRALQATTTTCVVAQ